MKKFMVNYHTGAGNKIVTGTLDEAMEIADLGSSYTQRSYCVCDLENPEKVYAFRNWWGLPYNPEYGEEENPICYGNFGYYSDWVIF